MTTIGSFGSQNFDFYNERNRNSAITSGVVFQINNDYNLGKNGSWAIRSAFHFNNMTFNPDLPTDFTKNSFNSVRSSYIGVGILARDKNIKRITSQVGLVLGLFTYNAGNQFANVTFDNIDYYTLGEESETAYGLGLNFNADFGYKLSKRFELIFRTDFFSSSADIPIEYAFYDNGIKEILSNENVKKSINYFNSNIGFKYWY